MELRLKSARKLKIFKLQVHVYCLLLTSFSYHVCNMRIGDPSFLFGLLCVSVLIIPLNISASGSCYLDLYRSSWSRPSEAWLLFLLLSLLHETWRILMV